MPITSAIFLMMSVSESIHRSHPWMGLTCDFDPLSLSEQRLTQRRFPREKNLCDTSGSLIPPRMGLRTRFLETLGISGFWGRDPTRGPHHHACPVTDDLTTPSSPIAGPITSRDTLREIA